MSKSTALEIVDGRRRPDPIPLSKRIYNSEKGTFLGRTATSWGKNLSDTYLVAI